MSDADLLEKKKKYLLELLLRENLKFNILNRSEQEKRVDFCSDIALCIMGTCSFLKKLEEIEHEQLASLIMTGVKLGIWAGDCHYIEAEYMNENSFNRDVDKSVQE